MLLNLSENSLILCHQVEEAHSFGKRALGLIGRKGLAGGSALWINSCSHIHTFFMSFAIDIIFVDKNLIVQKLFSNAKPWKHIFLGTFKAQSVFELPENSIKSLKVKIGDQLHVGT
jgi:uncharacterized membrane protein (UPF0127 family)